jgi:hypothetical protein
MSVLILPDDDQVATVAPTTVVPAGPSFEPKPDEVMCLADFQQAFDAIGGFFNLVKEAFPQQNYDPTTEEGKALEAQVELAVFLVKNVMVYIKDNTTFKMYFDQPQDKRLECVRLVKNEEFVLPPVPDDEERTKVAVDFDTLLKWSQRCFDFIEVARVFRGQGNRQLADTIMTKTSIVFISQPPAGDDPGGTGIAVKVDVDERSLQKFNDMVRSLVRERQEQFRSRQRQIMENQRQLKQKMMKDHSLKVQAYSEADLQDAVPGE